LSGTVLTATTSRNFDDSSLLAMQWGTCILLGGMLAQGGFAEVYLGTVLQHGPAGAAADMATTEVAVKVFKASVKNSSKQQLQDYAIQEQLALQALKGHPAVVQLLATAVLPDDDDATRCSTSSNSANQSSVFTRSSSSSNNRCDAMPPAATNSNGYLYNCLVLEYLVDGNLASSAGTLSEQQTKHMLRPVIELLEAMHISHPTLRIVHRDIKPGNLLVRRVMNGPPHAVLANFGCCHVDIIRHARPMAAMQTVIGTTSYAAPEMCAAARDTMRAAESNKQAAPCSYDASVNVFSLGITITQLLSTVQLPTPGQPRTQPFRQMLTAFVDSAPDATASAEVREFVGCCCGVGKLRDAARHRSCRHAARHRSCCAHAG
jgi:serine/threonine protein kinase